MTEFAYEERLKEKGLSNAGLEGYFSFLRDTTLRQTRNYEAHKDIWKTFAFGVVRAAQHGVEKYIALKDEYAVAFQFAYNREWKEAAKLAVDRFRGELDAFKIVDQGTEWRLVFVHGPDEQGRQGLWCVSCVCKPCNGSGQRGFFEPSRRHHLHTRWRHCRSLFQGHR